MKGTVKEAFEAQEKRINGLLQLNSKKAPETYEVPEGSIWADEAQAEATKPILDMFKESGVGQEHATLFMDLLGEFQAATVELATKGNQVDLMNEWNLTGEAFDARLNEVAQWGQENLDADEYERYRAGGQRGILDLEGRMLRNREQPSWKPRKDNDMPEGAMSEDQVREIMSSKAYKDPNEEGHAEARKKVRDHFVATTEDPHKIVARGKHQRTG